MASGMVSDAKSPEFPDRHSSVVKNAPFPFSTVQLDSRNEDINLGTPSKFLKIQGT